ncbi:hypothetical protein N6H18_07700 [Reichenbachiella agarivorans]|uniref:Uncharacterized protein n=1 Tax=Reichenbachiella agarivorans TaxID=2979464 RepID=A0ABY6CTI2_9BACT|nr:hypothetical protein [Reichenbachiella agarivorans]UXP33831.1 hypothetical protein N6H18_07700 [Reichenbachiella agarivorans]
MKNVRIFGLLLVFGLTAVMLTNCDSAVDALESCSQEEICPSKDVTACCDNKECVYKYDGKEYPEDDIDQLADDLGCGSSSNARVASTEGAELIGRLQDLLAEAKAGLK